MDTKINSTDEKKRKCEVIFLDILDAELVEQSLTEGHQCFQHVNHRSLQRYFRSEQSIEVWMDYKHPVYRKWRCL